MSCDNQAMKTPTPNLPVCGCKNQWFNLLDLRFGCGIHSWKWTFGTQKWVCARWISCSKGWFWGCILVLGGYTSCFLRIEIKWQGTNMWSEGIVEDGIKPFLISTMRFQGGRNSIYPFLYPSMSYIHIDMYIGMWHLVFIIIYYVHDTPANM